VSFIYRHAVGGVRDELQSAESARTMTTILSADPI